MKVRNVLAQTFIVLEGLVRNNIAVGGTPVAANGIFVQRNVLFKTVFKYKAKV